MHGGDVYGAARELGQDPSTMLDFSASINPLGPSASALRAFRRSANLLPHYPDPACWDLRQALAAHWQRPADEFLIGNGSTELIHILPRALGIRRLLIIGPTFSEYAAAMDCSAGQVTATMAERTDGYRPPLEAVRRLLTGSAEEKEGRASFDALVLCNPNSPTGQACEVKQVMTVARLAARLGVWLLLDETFTEYCEPASILSERPPATTLVLRSFTKFYGLPAVRIGYVVAHVRVIERLKARQPPWSVNMPAQVAAVAALRDKTHARRSLTFMARERARLLVELQRLPGCVAFPSEANFILLELPVGERARTIVAALRRQGLLIRDCSMVAGLNDRTVRVAVRSTSDNTRLLRALSQALGGKAS